MDVAKHFRSITGELESLKDRVRNFISGQHWLTDGEWKESVLRTFIAKRLPETIRIGRGFVLTEEGPTTQCDIILYRADYPVLFREADLVFLTADAVVGIVEVKSKVTKTLFRDSISKLAGIGSRLGRHAEHCCLALFSYEVSSNPRAWFADVLPQYCHYPSEIIQLINLGKSSFVKWWEHSPSGNDSRYENWHSYKLINMSAGYFIANIIDAVTLAPASLDERFWYPERSKEYCLLDHIPLDIQRYNNG